MKTVWYCQIGNQAPEFIRLLPLGEVILGDGRQPFRVTQRSLEKIIEAWKIRANDMVIDYEHQTTKGQEAPAAGWVKELSINKDGLWAKVTWTDKAKDYIESKEYRYFSPVVELGEDREVIDLLHVALTNIPAISNLNPLILQHQSCEESYIMSDTISDKNNKEVKILKVDNNNGMEKEENFIEKLRETLGLQYEASEAHLIAEVRELAKTKKEKSSALTKQIAMMLELKEEDAEKLALERIAFLKAEADMVNCLREEIVELKRKQSRQQAEHLIEEALRSKKTTPAELEMANSRLRRLAQDDPDFFQELILSRPENWAVPGPLGKERRSDRGLSQEEEKICELLGIAQEEFLRNRDRLAKENN